MSRNVVVSFAEGYSDDLDDKEKYGAIWFFAADLGAIYDGAIYVGLYTRLYSNHKNVTLKRDIKGNRPNRL